MHSFEELAQYCTDYMLGTLGETKQQVFDELQNSGATRLVKALQMIQLQKAISAVGVFSIFEAMLQQLIGGKHSFDEVEKILEREKEVELKKRFYAFKLAINVLKHGEGTSYKALEKIPDLPFRISRPNEMFDEGDVSEISTLVEVDDDFVEACADLIREVGEVVRRTTGNRN